MTPTNQKQDSQPNGDPPQATEDTLQPAPDHHDHEDTNDQGDNDSVNPLGGHSSHHVLVWQRVSGATALDVGEMKESPPMDDSKGANSKTETQKSAACSTATLEKHQKTLLVGPSRIAMPEQQVDELKEDITTTSSSTHHPGITEAAENQSYNMERFPTLERYSYPYGPEVGAFAVSGIYGSTSDIETASENEPVPAENSSLGVIDGAVVVDEQDEREAHEMDGNDATTTEEVIEGQLMKDNRRNQTHPGQAKAYVILVLFAILVGVAVILLVVHLPSDSASSQNDTNANAVVPKNTTASPSIVYPPFQEGLNKRLQRAFEDPMSPYAKANSWVWEDPNLESYSRERQLQRFYMASFFYFTGGQNWTRNDNWLSYDTSECNWYTAHYAPESVCDEGGDVVVFNMTSNNLQGDLTEASDFLHTPRVFDVSNNNLSGSSPSMTSSSINLEVFDVSNNKFTGVFHGGGMFVAFKLRVIKTDGNQFFGGGGGLVCQVVPLLEVFNNSGNLYNNAIAPTMGACQNLVHYSSKCDHVGPIPSELGLLSSLQSFDIEGNSRMTGTIPSELGLLTSLSSLDLSGTSITGPIPQSLCDRAVDGTLQIKANCSLVQCCK